MFIKNQFQRENFVKFSQKIKHLKKPKKPIFSGFFRCFLCFFWLGFSGWFFLLPTLPEGAAAADGAAAAGQEDAASLPPPAPARGDPEMVERYVCSLLPVFCSTFTATMIPSVKRAALGLVKKLVHYMDGPTLDSVSRAEVAG